MKRLCLTTAIVVFFLICFDGLQAQTPNKTIPLTLVELAELQVKLYKNPTQELLNKYNEEVNRTLKYVTNQTRLNEDLHQIWVEKINAEYTAKGLWTNPITGKVEQGSPAAYPSVSWNMDEILLGVLPFMSEFSSLQELKDRLQGKSQPKIPYTLFELTYVNKYIAEWQMKGEFEKTTDWQARVNDVTQKQKIADLKLDAVAEYAKWALQNVIGSNDNSDNYYVFKEGKCSGKYDADNEVYILNISILGNIPIKVPINEAKHFDVAVKKESVYVELRLSEMKYFIQNGELALSEATFTVFYSGERKIYKYINPAEKNRKKSTKEIELEKEQAKAYLVNAETSSDLARYTDAKQYYQKVMDLYPDIMNLHHYYALLRVYYKTEDYSQIFSTNQKILKLAPNGIEDVGAYYYLGFAYYQLKDYINAIEAYQHIIDSNYRFESGFSDTAASGCEDCYNVIITAIENIINSPSSLVDKAKAYIILGSAYYNRVGCGVSWYNEPSVYDKSIDAFEKAISLTSDGRNQATIYQKMGKVFEARRESSNAIKAYKKAAQLGDENAQIYLKGKGVRW